MNARSIFLPWCPALAVLLAGCSSAAPGSATDAPATNGNQPATSRIASQGPAHLLAPPGRPQYTPDGIVSGSNPGFGTPVYNGGPMMTGTIELVPIFYGTAWQPSYKSTILSFLKTMSQTSYWGVVEEYADKNGNHPGSVDLYPEVDETTYAYGKYLGPNDIGEIVMAALPYETQPNESFLFMVFTADDVNATYDGLNLCSGFLGYHLQEDDLMALNVNDSEYYFNARVAMVGSAEYCIANENGFATTAWNRGPNGEVTDMAITAAMHEAAEAATDPDGSSGMQPEIGDICAWVPGPLTDVCNAPPGFHCFPTSETNYDLGGGAPYGELQYGYAMNTGPEYLVQTLWDVNQGGCAYGPATADARIPIRIGF